MLLFSLPRASTLIQLLLACALLTAAMVEQVFAHGGVSMDEDQCVMRLGPYRAHFTGYQPSVRASQEFCEDIPVVAEALIVLDFIDASLREMAVDFRVIRDVNNIGINATWDDLGDQAAIEAASVFYLPADTYTKGNFNVALTFEQPAAFIGLVTATDQKSGTVYRSVFPFSVGIAAPWYSGWPWIVLVALIGIALYLQPWAKPKSETL